MADLEALFRITYGLYIVCSGNNKKGNGFISNTVFQVTSKPAKFAVCCNKDNLTAEFISRHGAFSVSVLERDTPAEIFSTFGYKSGKDTEKLSGRNLIYGETGVPVVLDSCIAWLELKLVNTFDAGTHLIFIGELINASLIDNAGEPITYTYYRQVRKAYAPKNAPTYIDQSALSKIQTAMQYRKFQCPECGYIYDEKSEKVSFEDLPDDWVCPVCGTPKSDFEEIPND